MYGVKRIEETEESAKRSLFFFFIYFKEGEMRLKVRVRVVIE
jgi:hypothetical protein